MMNMNTQKEEEQTTSNSCHRYFYKNNVRMSVKKKHELKNFKQLIVPTVHMVWSKVNHTFRAAVSGGLIIISADTHLNLSLTPSRETNAFERLETRPSRVPSCLSQSWRRMWRSYRVSKHRYRLSFRTDRSERLETIWSVSVNSNLTSKTKLLPPPSEGFMFSFYWAAAEWV